MRITRLLAAVVAVQFLSFASAQAQSQPKPAQTAQPVNDPARTKAAYDIVASHLDTGGDLLVVANLDGLIERTVEQIREVFEGLSGPAGGPPPTVVAAFGRLPAFLQTSGLDAIDGLGMSLVPRGDGLNNYKSFLRRDALAANRPLWLATVGAAPRRLWSLNYLPRDTAFARTSAGDVRQLWQFMRQAAEAAGGPAGAQTLDGWSKGLAGMLGTDLGSVLETLGADSFMAVQLSSTRTIQIPIPSSGADAPQMLTLPAPALLLGVAAKGETASKALAALLAHSKLPLVQQATPLGALQSATLPVPLPIPLSPSFAMHESMLLIGSTAEIVQEAMAAATSKNGLLADAAFKKMLADLPLENNGLAYVSPRFGATMTELQTRLMESAGARGGFNPASRMLTLLGGGSQQALVVTINEKDGVLTRGVTSAGGREMVASMAMAPVGMLSAIAIPSFMKARGRSVPQNNRSVSQNNSCVNNLRQLDGAKEQWTMEFNQAEGAKVDEVGVLQYIKGARMPVCPQGGTYTLNPIGEDPTCTIPGHTLAH